MLNWIGRRARLRRLPRSVEEHAPCIRWNEHYGLIEIGQSVDDAIVAMRGPRAHPRRKKRRST